MRRFAWARVLEVLLLAACGWAIIIGIILALTH